MKLKIKNKPSNLKIQECHYEDSMSFRGTLVPKNLFKIKEILRFAQDDKKRHAAFTLAEVLITLGIIGAVAAVTMPTLIAKVNERIYKSRHENIAQKVTQAMERMRALGKLDGSYNSTEAFVNELKKYLKISKICSAEHITDCWPVNEITTPEGDKFDVSRAKTGKDINLETTNDNVGLILADGAYIILNYDPNSAGIDIGDKVTVNHFYKYTTSVTNSIDFITDVNGERRPNREGEDIRSFKLASFTDVADKECQAKGGVLISSICTKRITVSDNCTWDEAQTACPEGWVLPDMETLQTFGCKDGKCPKNAFKSVASWATDEYINPNGSGYGFYMYYRPNGTMYEGLTGKTSSGKGPTVICISDQSN